MRFHSAPGIVSGLIACLVASAAEPQPAPPAVYLERNPSPVREEGRPVRPADSKALVEYMIGDPTPEEQAYLERVNRARLRPWEEGFLLATSTDPDILEAYRFFSVDLQRAVDEIALYPVVQPLSFEPRLTEAARGHTRYMMERAVQAHEERDPVTGAVVNNIAERVTAAGYPWTAAGESIYAYSRNVEHGHAGFEIDWGPGDGGVQRPPGHRDNNHNAAFREAGVGVLAGTRTVVTATSTNTVGPQLVTIDFGRRSDTAPKATGVAYYDVDGNGRYDVGEGIPGVRIESAAAGAFATTRRSGGYTVPIPAGAGRLRFLVDSAEVTNVAVTGVLDQNVKVDLALPYVGPVAGGPAIVPAGGVGIFGFVPLPGAVEHRSILSRVDPYSFVDGAEGGATNMDVSVSPGWNPVKTGAGATGQRWYQMVHATPADQSLTVRPVLRPGVTATVQFRSMLGFSTVSQTALVEVSRVGSQEWTAVFTRPGWGTNNFSQTAFANQSASLAAFAGADVRVRFRYRIGNGTYYNQSGPSFGWNLDEIRFTDTEVLGNPVTNSVVAGAPVVLEPEAAGRFELAIQPVLAGVPLPAGRPVSITAGPGAALGGGIVVESLARKPAGGFELVFGLRSGVAAGWFLEGAPSPAGPWAEVGGATRTRTAPGRYRYDLPSDTGTRFLRVSTR